MTVASKAEEGKGGFFGNKLWKKGAPPFRFSPGYSNGTWSAVRFFENQIRPLAYHTTYATRQEKQLALLLQNGLIEQGYLFNYRREGIRVHHPVNRCYFCRLGKLW